MPSTPTTKSQVQAYQFVLRRMQSALVRRDAVMLNDPMRTHSRATIVGVVLGGLGMVVFIVWGLLSPQPAVPNSGSIVIGEQSGTVYVVTGNPKRLIPTFNLASARLLLLAQQKQQTGAPGAAGSAPAPASTGTQTVVNPTVVSDTQLADIPRDRLAGIPDGPQLIPTDAQRISANWAVCDQVQLDPTQPVQDAANKTDTYVFGGLATDQLGRELGEQEALLAQGDNGRTYLVYRLPSTPNRPNANTVRAEVDLGNSQAVKSALQLPDKARKISQGLLNSIPEEAKLTAPNIEGAGDQAPADFDGLVVGDVFSTQPAGTAPDYWVITKTGIQKVSSAVADIIRVAKNGSSGRVKTLGLDKLRLAPLLQATDAGYLRVDGFPRSVPTVLDATQGTPVACLGWSLIGDQNSPDPHTSVYVSNLPPGPRKANGTSASLPLRTPGPNGVPVTGFYMRSGFAAVVQSATGKDSFGKGAIQLISDRGMRYGVPDATTADAIGLNKRLPAPESIISLLPTGASLNTQDVLREFDSVPVDQNAGSYPTASRQAAGN